MTTLVNGVIMLLTGVVNSFGEAVNIIFAKFLNLEKEKQQRILNAAIKEFAQKGFKNASTNEIVKEAEISKGLLFHYFKNKKYLYLFLYDYCIELIVKEFYEKINLDEKDIFIRVRQMALLKYEIFKRHPEIYNFIMAAYFEDASEVKNDIENRTQELITSSYSKIFEGIDISKFREDIDIKRVINIITWTIEGFANREQNKVRAIPLKELNYDEALTEIDAYFEILKNCFYK